MMLILRIKLMNTEIEKIVENSFNIKTLIPIPTPITETKHEWG